MRVFAIFAVVIFLSTSASAEDTIYHCTFLLLSPTGKQVSAGKATLEIDDSIPGGVAISGDNLFSGAENYLLSAFSDTVVWSMWGNEHRYWCVFYRGSRMGGCLTPKGNRTTDFPAFYECKSKPATP
jgi:hypothetical protein